MITDAIAQHLVEDLHSSIATRHQPPQRDDESRGHIPVPMTLLLSVMPWAVVALVAWAIL